MDFAKVLFVFLAIFAASALSKPFTIDVLESSDLFFPKESDLVKRTAVGSEGSNDIAELSIPKISLSSFIDNIESGLIQTALSADSLAGSSNAQIPDVIPPHFVHKRSTVETAIETTTANSNPETVVLQKSEKVLASESIPAHVVIDRVTVYKAPEVGSVLFPTFHISETITSNETGEVLTEVNEDLFAVDGSILGNRTDSSSSESSESTESSESSQGKDSSTSIRTTSGDKTHDTSSSIGTEKTSTPLTTTPVPVDDKEIVEKDLKEKVAEVEAEPVILTARV